MPDDAPGKLPPSAYVAIAELLEVQRKMIETSAELSVVLRQSKEVDGYSTARRQAILTRIAELIAIFEHSSEEIKRLIDKYRNRPS